MDSKKKSVGHKYDLDLEDPDLSIMAIRQIESELELMADRLQTQYFNRPETMANTTFLSHDRFVKEQLLGQTYLKQRLGDINVLVLFFLTIIGGTLCVFLSHSLKTQTLFNLPENINYNYLWGFALLALIPIFSYVFNAMKLKQLDASIVNIEKRVSIESQADFKADKSNLVLLDMLSQIRKMNNPNEKA